MKNGTSPGEIRKDSVHASQHFRCLTGGYPHQILGEMEEKHQTQFQGDKVISTVPNLGQNNKWNMKGEAPGKKQ